ncbi:MAG: hypothetical protein NUV65_04415 [Candidatus Roizmanbacteria bacterium]|nr:hypothetical protein [Candidatus Roizmanbacteria bacterium]
MLDTIRRIPHQIASNHNRLSPGDKLRYAITVGSIALALTGAGVLYKINQGVPANTLTDGVPITETNKMPDVAANLAEGFGLLAMALGGAGAGAAQMSGMRSTF